MHSLLLLPQRIYFVACIVCLFLHSPTIQAYKPKILGDFDALVGAVLFGSRVRYDVIDFHMCDVSIPDAMQLSPFMVEFQSAEVNRGSDELDGVIVTSYEQEMLGAGYGNKSLILRQFHSWIRFDGSASIYVVDYQPVTFKIYADATLNCVWQNGTDGVKTAGIRIWAQEWQASEMGTMDRLVEGVNQGHTIFFYIDAGSANPPQYRSHWAGAVHDITSSDNGTITFYSQTVSQTHLIGMEINTATNGSVTIKRNVLDRTSGGFVSCYFLTGTFGYDPAPVHFYWKNLFLLDKGHHSV